MLLELLVTIVLFSVDNDVKDSSKVILFYWCPPKLCCSYSCCQCACQCPNIYAKGKGDNITNSITVPCATFTNSDFHHQYIHMLHCPVEGRSYTPKKISQVCILQKPIIILGAPREAAKFPSTTTPLVPSLSTHRLPNHILLATLKNEQISDIIYLRKISNKISKPNKNREVKDTEHAESMKRYETIIKIFCRPAKSKFNYTLTIKSSFI